jgi:hypothetical protein
LQASGEASADSEMRLDVLVHVRMVVEPYGTPLTKDIVVLLQREADLLSRNTKAAVFVGLRQRLLNLFLQFCETPEFNPEAARFMAVHSSVQVGQVWLCIRKKKLQSFSFDMLLILQEVRSGFRKCFSCGKCLPLADFDVSFTRKDFGKCLPCLRLENQCLARADGTHHERILREIQKSELASDPQSRCCFALSLADMRFLLESVWGGKSCLSQETDLAQLVCVRWRAAEHWTPWNCIVLTRPQADAHLALSKPESVYGPAFIALVTAKHLQARAKFAALAKEFP